MLYMVYLKDDRQDKRYRVINPKTSCYIDKLIYAHALQMNNFQNLKYGWMV